MLVLSRKQTETITIGDQIVVKIVQAGRHAVKIGIDAPDGLRVLRGELQPQETETADTPQEPDASLATMAARVRRLRRQHPADSLPVEMV